MADLPLAQAVAAASPGAATGLRRAPAVPRVALVGVGRFGQHHLATWQQLAAQGRVTLAALVVQSRASAERLAAHTGLAVHTALGDALAAGVDLVDIATPAASHAALVRQCLPHAHVLVEKPLAGSAAEARVLHALAAQHGHVLATGHTYFHHPLTQALVQAAQAFAGTPHTLDICFTNPLATRVPGLDPLAEWIHAFDLFALLAQGELQACSAWPDGDTVVVSLATQGGSRTVLRLGWQGVERVRSVQLACPDLHVSALYDDQLLQTQRRDRTHKQWVPLPHTPLALQMQAFLEAAAGRAALRPAPAQVERSLALVEQARAALAPASRRPAKALARSDRPRVAVLGGGVFGASCAVELAKSCDVVLFERHAELLQEASWINQWRHHSGFHYPRSIETIREVVSAKADFEATYHDVILRDVEAYYAVSAFASEITPDRYMATCRANGLAFEEVPAPADLVLPERVSVCLRTDEGVVEIGRLSRQLMATLNGQAHIEMRLGTEVVGGRLLPDGRKQLSLAAGQAELPPFDFVVNATYANRNRVSRWFGFPQRPLRFDLMEMSVLRIPGARRFMMTILDAPFTSLTSTGEDEMFMLSGIHQSVLASQVTPDGLPPAWPQVSSNRAGLLAHGLRYMPLLAQAQHVESRVGVRAVEAYTDDFDGRPTVVTPHGFGCWSVLGGKIITVVSNARHLAAQIALQTQHLRG